MNNFFLKEVVSSPTLLFRSISKFNVGKPIKYYGFTYFPRYPDQPDEPLTPSKLFLVKRIKRLSGECYLLKDIMKNLGFKDKSITSVVVKNIPHVNSDLYRVKHLIKITPITFPNGEPTEQDIGACLLRDNGEMIISKKLTPDESVVKATEKLDSKQRTVMDGLTIRKQTRLKWIQCRD